MTTALSSYTLAQLQTDVKYLTGDIQGTRFSPALLNDAINYAIKMLVQIKGYSYIERNIVSNTENQQGLIVFPLSGTLADSTASTYNYMDYIEIRRVMNGGVYYSPTSVSANTLPQVQILKSTVAEEDMKNPSWRQSQMANTGLSPIPPFVPNTNQSFTGNRWVLQDGNTIVVVSPGAPNVVDVGVVQYGVITVGYIQQPALLSSDSDTVDSRIPLTVQQYIKYAAAAWLLALDNSDATSLETAKLYQSTFQQLIGGA